MSELSFKTGGRIGLGDGESLEKRNLPVPKVADSRPLPAAGSGCCGQPTVCVAVDGQERLEWQIGVDPVLVDVLHIA